jgi:dienelactone hydrolase
MPYRVILWSTILLINVFSVLPETGKSVRLIDDPDLKTFTSIAQSSWIKMPAESAWKKAVPSIKTVLIQSSYDGTSQPALFYDSKSGHARPLLVALHSWSENYLQQFSIPYGIWAQKNNWIFIHPDYRGPFTNALATASDAALADIIDAVHYAKKFSLVDSTRIYITGFSGGAMVTLIMAARYPELWAGAAAWVPVYDLTEWYHTTIHARHNYSKTIESSCGGPPLPDTEAEQECAKRSVSSYLSEIKDAPVKIYIATGIKDRFVPPGHALKAFNDLSDILERFSIHDIAYINKNHSLPISLQSQKLKDSLFSDAKIPLLFERISNNTTIKIFDGGHDILYNAGLFWLSQQIK